MYPEQLELMYGLVQAPHLHTFCETGFNAGHSFALYCSQADKRPVSIVSFDLFNKNYSLAVLDVLKEPCGKKLRTAVVAPGDSRVTIERFAATNPAFQCDFVYVDGGHDGDVPYLDLANLNRMSRRGATVVIDDIESPVIADASVVPSMPGSSSSTSATATVCCSPRRRPTPLSAAFASGRTCNRPLRATHRMHTSASVARADGERVAERSAPKRVHVAPVLFTSVLREKLQSPGHSPLSEIVNYDPAVHGRSLDFWMERAGDLYGNRTLRSGANRCRLLAIYGGTLDHALRFRRLVRFMPRLRTLRLCDVRGIDLASVLSREACPPELREVDLLNCVFRPETIAAAWRWRPLASSRCR